MLKEFSWELFEKSGSIEAYILYRKLVETENDVKDMNFLDKIFTIQEVAVSK
jgi:hypothetical protein